MTLRSNATNLSNAAKESILYVSIRTRGAKVRASGQLCRHSDMGGSWTTEGKKGGSACVPRESQDLQYSFNISSIMSAFGMY